MKTRNENSCKTAKQLKRYIEVIFSVSGEKNRDNGHLDNLKRNFHNLTYPYNAVSSCTPRIIFYH